MYWHSKTKEQKNTDGIEADCAGEIQKEAHMRNFTLKCITNETEIMQYTKISTSKQ